MNTAFVLIAVVISLIIIGLNNESNAWASLDVDKKTYQIANLQDKEIKIMGNLDSFNKNHRLYLVLTSPDGSSQEIDLKVFEKGQFSHILKIDEKWQEGEYNLFGYYGETEIGKTSFEIDKSIAHPFANINSQSEKSVPESKSSITTISTKANKIPDWVKNTFKWYIDGQISEDDVINAIQYLVNSGIIKLQQSEVTQQKTITSAKPSFVDPNVDPKHYISRYINEPTYKKWFDENYPEYTIYEAVGISESEYLAIIKELKQESEPAPVTKTEPTNPSSIITNKEFQIVFSDPEKYKNQWAKLRGEIEQMLVEDDGIAYVFNIAEGGTYDLTKRVWLFSKNSNLNIKEDECLLAEGKIQGGAEAVLLLTGASREIPVILLEKHSKITCLEAQFPAFKSIEVNKSKTEGNVKLTVKKIELSDYHTRLYVEVENTGNPNGINFLESSTIIIQNKRQFEYDFGFGLDFKRLSYEIPNDVIEDGVILLDPIANEPFELVFKAGEFIEGGYYGEYKYYEFRFQLN